MTVAQRSTANSLITDKGQAVTVTYRTSGAYNTATGVAGVTETTATGTAVFFDYAPGMRFASGGSILAKDKQVLLSALNTAGGLLARPDPGDTITDVASVKWIVVAVDDLSPAGLDIMYTCQVRGAD